MVTKRWKVDVNSRQDAVLLLSSVNLPGGVQVRQFYSCCLREEKKLLFTQRLPPPRRDVKMNPMNYICVNSLPRVTF